MFVSSARSRHPSGKYKLCDFHDFEHELNILMFVFKVGIPQYKQGSSC